MNIPKLSKKTWIIIVIVIAALLALFFWPTKSEASIFDVPKEFEILNGQDVSVFRVGIAPIKRTTIGFTTQGVFDNTLLGFYGKYPVKELSSSGDNIGLQDLPIEGVPYLGLSALFDVTSNKDNEDGRVYWTPEIGVTISDPDSGDSGIKWSYAYQDFRGQSEQMPNGQVHLIGVIIPLK